MDASLEPLSRNAQWNLLLQKNNLRDLHLKDAPLELIYKINCLVQKHWNDTVKLHASIVSARLSGSNLSFETSKKWMKWASHPVSPVTIEDLVAIFYEDQGRLELNTILEPYSRFRNPKLEALESERRKADESEQSMKQISKDTLQELAKRIEEYDNWKLLFDGLNVDNFKVKTIKTAYSLLENWMTFERFSATRARLILETRELKMFRVVHFIEAISQEAIPKISLKELSYSVTSTYPVTRYHIRLIEDEFLEDGKGFSWTALFPDLYEDSDTINSDLIWQTGEISIDSFLKMFGSVQPLKRIVRKIKENKVTIANARGVTLEQVVYLSNISFACPPPRAIFGPNGILGETFSSKETLSIYNFTPLAKANFPGKPIDDYTRMSFKDFLYLLWQYNDRYSLKVFGNRVINILDSYENSLGHTMLEKFKERLADITPVCVYDPEEAAKNLDKMKRMTEKARSLSEIALLEMPLESETKVCIICIEREITYIAVPCGHFNYCRECIEKLHKCAVCNGPIKQKVKVYMG